MNATEMLKDSKSREERPTLSSVLSKAPLTPPDAPERLVESTVETTARGVAVQPSDASERRVVGNEELGSVRDPKERKEREPRLQPMARKLAETANLLVQVAQREDAKRLAEHERVRAICNTVFGGGLTRLLRESPLLTGDDKDFLKDLKYI